MDIQTIGHGAVAVLKWTALVLGALIAIIVIGSVVVPPLTRGMTDRWGATDAEVAATLPADEYVRSPKQSATRAITIDAPATLVMQLIRQQGMNRAGWHGWDGFYRATGCAGFVDGHYSTRVVPELQDLQLGDKIYINPAVFYFVEQDSAPASSTPGVFALFIGAAPDGTPVRASGAGTATSSTSWVWVATPIGENRTRLVLRIRGDMTGQGAFTSWLFDNPLDFGGALFANKTLRGIKRTAESLARS